jgi:tetratricopeptide (TPR) repeat protein
VSSSRQERVAEVLEGYLASLDASKAVDRDALLAEHADIADDLAAALDGLDFVHRVGRDMARAASEAEEHRAGESLGDFRLLREVGRGGMAVVYEAEQASLGRRVALKVLPFAAVLDPKQLQRFKNEALAAAHLRHPHIVPVYGVGCERGVHYYAMQYVEGQSLDAAIRELRHGVPASGPRTPVSSHGSNRERSYVRMAAELGAQAAEALDHAHQMGIVHRDVKPGNLLVDAAGSLWVTDFGLARSAFDVGLTMTGELLGTVRYMSPEQALAKRVPVDHRTDVYSLGATLYELLTLEPAFPGEDAHRVIQDLATKDPVSPRRLNPALPVDLETILLKAMSKDPSARYATALEMADDLRRFLGDEPVRARRPPLAARAGRWARRHKGLVAATAVALVAAVGVLVVDAVRVSRALDRAEANLAIARSAVDKFLVEAGVGDMREGPLPAPARRALFEEALRFYERQPEDYEALLARAMILHGLRRYEEAVAVLRRADEAYPSDVHVLARLGHLLWHVDRPADALAVLEAADRLAPDRYDIAYHRSRALLALDRTAEALEVLDRAVAVEPKNGPLLAQRAFVLGQLGKPAEARDAARAALDVEPFSSEAWNSLGNALDDLGQKDDAIAAYTKAIEFDPTYGGTYINRADAHKDTGRLDLAIADYDKALELEGENADTISRKADALAQQGRIADATREFDRSIALDPSLVGTYLDYGNMRKRQGDYVGAIGWYEEALRRAVPGSVDEGRARGNIGGAYSRQGRFREAMPWFRQALALKAPWPPPSLVEEAAHDAELEGRLDGILAGTDAVSAQDRAEAAHILARQVRHADAVRCWSRAFAEDPALADDLREFRRYNAACAAVLGAAQPGADSTTLRAQALAWLRADLMALEGKPRVRRLVSWTRDEDFLTVRDGVADLPEPERGAWTALWKDVDASLERAKAGK